MADDVRDATVVGGPGPDAASQAEPRSAVEAAADPAHGGWGVVNHQLQGVTVPGASPDDGGPVGEKGIPGDYCRPVAGVSDFPAFRQSGPVNAPSPPEPEDLLTFAGQAAGEANGAAATALGGAYAEMPLSDRFVAGQVGGGSTDPTFASAGSAAQPAPQRTLVSGIKRIHVLANRAAPVLSEFSTLVGLMDGNVPRASGLTGTGSTEKSGTAGAMHDAVSLLESFVQQVESLVRRAKAAHG